MAELELLDAQPRNTPEDEDCMEHGRAVLDQTTAVSPDSSRNDNLILFAIAAAIALAHILTNGRYGVHRDEWQTLSDALHMDWGFVAYPPFTPFVERISMAIFGQWLIGLRLASVTACATVIVVTGLMARELGGGRLAQATAALSVALAPLALFEGTEFQYTTFDYLWWVLIAYFVIRMLKSDDARWCVLIGVCVGLGLMTKYTMVFYATGVILGAVLTPARKFLVTKWFWCGMAIAFLICLPNVIWQVRHDFISYHFLHHIHVRDVGEGRAEGYWKYQFWVNTDSFTIPLWIAGLVFYLRESKYRMLAVMYLFPLFFFALTKARFYYMGAAYPMVLAMGAVAGERWVGSMRRGWRFAITGVALAGIIVWGLLVSAILVPWAPGGTLKEFALKNNGDLREEIGWQELVQAVAGVRDSLPREQQANFGILVGNYGEMGSIELLGPAYKLPPPISLTNSGYLRSYPTRQPSTLIVVGWSQRQVDEAFTGCRAAGHNGNSLGVKNEESADHADIYVCGGPKDGWPTFWKEHQRFG